MIIVIKKGANSSQVENLMTMLKSQNISPHISEGSLQTVIGCVGDVAHLDPGLIEAIDVVESVQRIQEPYKAVNRKFHPDDSMVDCAGVKVGAGHFAVIAGPCSVESEEQIVEVAKRVKESGATLLRGGAFKPRTSPYDFQGLKADGIDLLLEAKKETGLPIVSEIMDASQLPLFDEIDIIQVGTRNMQKALMYALLEPSAKLKELELAGDYTSRLALLEEYKSYPFAAVWDYYCELQGVPACDEEWFATVMKYEEEVQLKRA